MTTTTMMIIDDDDDDDDGDQSELWIKRDKNLYEMLSGISLGYIWI